MTKKLHVLRKDSIFRDGKVLEAEKTVWNIGPMSYFITAYVSLAVRHDNVAFRPYSNCRTTLWYRIILSFFQNKNVPLCVREGDTLLQMEIMSYNTRNNSKALNLWEAVHISYFMSICVLWFALFNNASFEYLNTCRARFQFYMTLSFYKTWRIDFFYEIETLFLKRR